MRALKDWWQRAILIYPDSQMASTYYKVESLIWFFIFPVANQVDWCFDGDCPQSKCVPNVFERSTKCIEGEKKNKKPREIRLSVSVFICSENGPGATFLVQCLWTIAAVQRRRGAEEIISMGLIQAFSGKTVRQVVPLAFWDRSDILCDVWFHG